LNGLPAFQLAIAGLECPNGGPSAIHGKNGATQ